MEKGSGVEDVEVGATGTAATIAIISSNQWVEEDFPDPLTLKLGSKRKRKHICTDFL